MVDLKVDVERVRSFEGRVDSQQTSNYGIRHATRTRQPPLVEGQQVKVRGDEPRRGVIVGRHDREVTVDTGTHLLRRNRSQVVPVGTAVFTANSTVQGRPSADPTIPPVGETPILPQEPLLPSADTNAPVGANAAEPPPVGASTSAAPPVGGQYVTRSGRTSRPPDRMDL